MDLPETNKTVEKLKKVDIYAEWLLLGVYLVKEEDGKIYLLDNGIISKEPLSLDPNGLCYMLPYNSLGVRWYSVEKAKDKFKKANIIQIKCRNGISPFVLSGGGHNSYDSTIRYEMGDHVLIIDIYKKLKNDR